MSTIRFLHTIDYKRNPIKLDLLDSRFFVFEENRVAFDIKILKTYRLVYRSYELLAEVVTFYSLDPRLRPQHLFKECCLFDGEAYFKNSSFIFNLFKNLFILIY